MHVSRTIDRTSVLLDKTKQNAKQNAFIKNKISNTPVSNVTDAFNDIKNDNSLDNTNDTDIISALRDPQFSPENFFHQHLFEVTDDEIYNFHSRLKDLYADSQLQLKGSAIQTFQTMIELSRDATKAQDQVESLRALMKDFQQITNELLYVDGNSTIVKHGNQPLSNLSPDFQSIYSSQIAHIWNRIEGSKTMVSESQGRHVVYSSKNWVEVKSVTFREKRAAEVIFFNDALLLAVSNYLQSSDLGSFNHSMHKIKDWKAYKLWPFTAIFATTFPESDDPSNHTILLSFKDEERIILQTQDPDEKNLFISLLKCLKSDMYNVKKSSPGVSDEDIMRYYDDTECTNQLKKMSIKDQAFEFQAPKLMGKDLNANSILDDLDVAIINKNYRKAAEIIESCADSNFRPGQKRNLSPEYLEKFENLTSECVLALLAELKNNTFNKQKVVYITSLLRKLDCERKAQDIYLSVRANIIYLRLHQIQFKGDVLAYISSLSVAFFTLLKNTITIYLEAFTNRQLQSIFTVWIQEQTDMFASLVSNQMTLLSKEEQNFIKTKHIFDYYIEMFNNLGFDLSHILHILNF